VKIPTVRTKGGWVVETAVKKAAKKKAKKKAATKKGKSKRPSVRSAGSKRPVNLQALREQLTRLVAVKMAEMADAISEEAVKGHLPQFKYLLEAIGLYPSLAEGNEESVEGDDLAKSLLQTFEFPNGVTEEDASEVGAPARVGGDSVE
jgi:hypothetical protein